MSKTAVLEQPPRPNEALHTRRGRRVLIGKSLNKALELSRGYGVAIVYPEEIGIRVDRWGKVVAVW